MLLTDEMVETIVLTFFSEIKYPRPRNWTKEDDAKLLEKSKIAMIKAINKVEDIKPSFGDGSFVVRKVLTELKAENEV